MPAPQDQHIKIGEIKQPVLIIWGRQDRVLPVAHGQSAVTRFPTASLEVIENCGHLPMFEETKKFNKYILDVLGN